ncbi:hypothetical protein K9N68_03690 [Kovacikia minuta CCNUW1]|uniref:hypothetical protein n=1 Tax=Kovacikia minuta TaxID=2931930 RepID=UPI001CCBEB42|nr:hypothetical protein [Kovacikia minuta]UBF27085.1 hypothetical protein K9N68_03690 [Kovacikia minuta CCNUW1]
MAVELGSVTLEHLTQVLVQERARIVRHSVPGMSGDLAQTMGRPSVEVIFRGILYGSTAADDLKQLRSAYLDHQPVDFFTEAVGEGYFAQVLISNLEVAQRAGYPDEFDFVCKVVEYIEPPQPIVADPFALPDTDLLNEAASLVDEAQNALDQVSKLTDLIANIPSFGDPTEGLSSLLGDYSTLISEGTGVLNEIKDLF